MQAHCGAHSEVAQPIGVVGVMVPWNFPIQLSFGVNDEMTIMKDEIFGPFLPIKPYREADEVIAYVNAHDRPLAFYPLTLDKPLAERYVTEVLSGSVGINEAIVQVGQHDLPFGGVGASGMGHYHGDEGFLTFSKLRPIFRQARISSIQAALLPPYGTRSELALDVSTRCEASRFLERQSSRRLGASSPTHGVSWPRCRTGPVGRRLHLPVRT
jgi:delta 1-pyrroline-5-carboxylate dehydrogenase